MSIALPPSLFLPLLNPIKDLEGVTEKEALRLSKACGGETITDLLFSLPTKIIERNKIFSIKEISSLDEGDLITLSVTLYAIKRPPPRSRAPWRLLCGDQTGKIEISIFGKAYHSLLQQGNEIILSGKLRFFKNKPIISNPDHLVLRSHKEIFPWIEPIWPLSAGLRPKIIEKALKSALRLTEKLPEWHDKTLIAQKHYPSFSEALYCLHQPISQLKNEKRQQAFSLARERLQADEILAHQMCISMAQFYALRRKGQRIIGTGKLEEELFKNFGYTPTLDQQKAIREIKKELSAPYPMQRLLQGDVGSGKTFVAFSSMITTIESGKQAAIMAPTEILAQQHFQEAQKISPVKPVLLTGKISSEKRKEVIAAIKNGKARFIIGTHALFQKEIIFHELGLAIIDEQHRFGVEQRISLGKKSDGVNLLLMSATPIPRSIQLTRWGQMGVSRLLQRPPGSGNITTTLHDISHGIDLIKDSLRRVLKENKRIYWVCPAVKESEMSAAAEERYNDLRKTFGDEIVGLAHGQQSGDEQEESLRKFRDGKIKILISTTLIEVGVNVPEASIMIIEDAQRFGLAQLHQLRGRVGRGSLNSYCLLLYRQTESGNGLQRLSLLRESLDGFYIAEEDYKQRGGGEITGNRQSGLPHFALSQNNVSDILISQSSQEAALILNKDPRLSSKRGDAIRGLMYLFKKTSPETVLLSG
ncbi:ATP-dependent DNA helicase RecG [Acetobacteraceae bacterium]|nr:ATP-dependent DNA helicase RecG [Acetobacteraceae bacterium]